MPYHTNVSHKWELTFKEENFTKNNLGRKEEEGEGKEEEVETKGHECLWFLYRDINGPRYANFIFTWKLYFFTGTSYFSKGKSLSHTFENLDSRQEFGSPLRS